MPFGIWIPKQLLNARGSWHFSYDISICIFKNKIKSRSSLWTYHQPTNINISLSHNTISPTLHNPPFAQSITTIKSHKNHTIPLPIATPSPTPPSQTATNPKPNPCLQPPAPTFLTTKHQESGSIIAQSLPLPKLYPISQTKPHDSC